MSISTINGYLVKPKTNENETIKKYIMHTLKSRHNRKEQEAEPKHLRSREQKYA